MSKKKKKKTSWKYIGFDIMIAAKVNHPNDPRAEWAAYILYVGNIEPKQAKIKATLENGYKLQKSVAEIYFPEFAKYRFRY